MSRLQHSFGRRPGIFGVSGLIDAHSHAGLSTSGESLGEQNVDEASDSVTADLRSVDPSIRDTPQMVRKSPAL